MRTIVRAAVALLMLVLPARADTACLQIGRIWSFHPLDNRTLIVEDELHQKFKVSLMGECPHLTFDVNLGIKSQSGIGGLDCVRRGDDVIAGGVGTNFTCPVTSVVPYTPEMEKADQTKAGEGSR